MFACAFYDMTQSIIFRDIFVNQNGSSLACANGKLSWIFLKPGSSEAAVHTVSIKKFVNFLRQHLRWKPFYTYVALENFLKISRTATFSDCLENLEAAPSPIDVLKISCSESFRPTTFCLNSASVSFPRVFRNFRTINPRDKNVRGTCCENKGC